jgi:signal transduction histidine kinase
MEKQSVAKFWIIITAAFFLVGLILVAWFITLESTEKEVLEKYNQQQLLLLEGTAVGVEGLFSDLAASLGSLGELAGLQYFHENDTRVELARKLEELTPLGITNIGILDRNGMGRFFTVGKESEGVDYSWRSYFKEAQQRQLGDNSDLIMVELQTIRPRELGFIIAIPIFETAVNAEHPSPSGDFAGVIIGSLALDTLVQRHIIPFKPPGEGHIFLVNDEYDIIWSSDNDINQANILGSEQRTLAKIADQMVIWEQGVPQGGFYEYKKPTGWNNIELIAFAPLNIGGELMVVGVVTPEEVARQTSLSNYKNQQLIFIVSVITIFVGVLIGGLVLGREIRRRFLAEEALQKSEMEQAIIVERNRLAGDLHDSVTQGLYGMVLHADAAKGQLLTGKITQATAYLEEIKTAGKEALAEMRLLIFELRPPVLEQEGLSAALETRLYAVEKRAGLKTEFDSQIDGRLPFEIEEGLYRIAQEALNNALKHAQAQRVWVYLAQVGEVVTLTIVDDGCGLEIETARKSGGMGLVTMGERATKLAGVLTIESSPGGGTRIVVEVKL